MVTTGWSENEPEEASADVLVPHGFVMIGRRREWQF